MDHGILEKVLKLFNARISDDFKTSINLSLEILKNEAEKSSNPFDDLLADTLIEIMNEA